MQYHEIGSQERVLKNNLKLNIVINVLAVVVFTLSCTAFDWTHIGKDESKYHISLIFLS